MIKITITTDNAAFSDGDEAAEVARILIELSDAIKRNDRATDYTLRDSNGNKVGRCETVED